jgi:TolB-like protein
MSVRRHGLIVFAMSVLMTAPGVTAAIPGSAGALHAQEASPGSAGVADARVSGSVAVIPFVNISRDAADDWIGEGIAETVMADLESAGDLTVIARERVRAATGSYGAELDDSAVTVLGRELGARWVLTGGYQRLGTRLRITARLVDTASSVVARTVKVDGTLDEIFALQDRIANELTTNMRSSTMARRGSRAAGLPDSVGTGGNGAGTTDTLRPGQVTGGIILPGTPGANAVTSAPGGGAGAAGRPGAVGTASSAAALTGRPSVTAGRAPEPPQIDGQLDDAIWQGAIRLTEFSQVRPVDGAPATEETEVWIAYDSGNIYFAMHAHYTDPSIARANRVDRDQTRSDDTISVYLDTFFDQQRAYVFSVNGYGVQGDSLLASRGSSGGSRGGSRGGGFSGGGFSGGGFSGVPSGDSSWDALFDSAGTLVADGWTAEMAIPFKSLRYPSSDTHRWGFQVVRSIGGKDETVVWSPVTRGNTFMSQMGQLDGLSGL